MDMSATDQQSGVLLYFYYIPLFGRQDEERQWMYEMCKQLNLRGRVRIARDGINATLGGTLAELREHAIKVAERYNTTEIDFKLSSSAGKKSEVYAKDSGFNSLTVSICKEVVSFGMDSIAPHMDVTQPPEPAPRISPAEFHGLLEAAQNRMDTSQESTNREVVLLDCRNLYETRIGRFQVANVVQLDPETRTFADLPAWIESNTHRLAGRQVLMYCTGGVRCERASAYLRSLGECFRTNGAVFQLQGGIERYLEQFSDGGFFAGKNFVFDERGEKGGSPLRDDGIDELQSVDQKETVGKGAGAPCCCCGALWHDYSKDRFRCVHCRMLVMICNTCSNAITSYGNLQTQDLCCELCRQRIQFLSTTSLTKTIQALGRRLRILCLHGFRQTGRNFRGRTAALQKRLKEYVEFVFVDGPYRLPFVVQPKMSELNCEASEVVSKMLNTSGARDPKRAWLVTPQQLSHLQITSEESVTIDDKGSSYQFDTNQYKFQTEGWDESYSVLNDALERMGPCDGILGFSQGAAIAAAMAALESKSQNLSKRFKFVIICSGYISAVPEHRVALNEWRDQGGVPLPSLHLYTADAEADRQIVPSESTALWECFQPQQRTLLRHGNGHLIPSTKAAAARVLHFLEFAMTST
jgi:predicted sulfurtransferase/predicted esterase